MRKMISHKILAESTVQQIHAEDEEKEENWEKRLACSATKPQRSEAVKLLHFTLHHSSPSPLIIILINCHPYSYHPHFMSSLLIAILIFIAVLIVFLIILTNRIADEINKT